MLDSYIGMFCIGGLEDESYLKGPFNFMGMSLSCTREINYLILFGPTQLHIPEPLLFVFTSYGD
jgi:hypothetical protein